MNAVDMRLGPSYSIVISGPRGSEGTRAFYNQLSSRFVPNKVVLLNEPGRAGKGCEPFPDAGTGNEDGRKWPVCTETQPACRRPLTLWAYLSC